MLKLLKYYCHGYVAMPVIEACFKQGLFTLPDGNKFHKRTWLIKELKADEGYFSVALQSLESLGMLEKNDKDAYRLTNRADKYLFNHGLTSLYAIAPEALLQNSAYARQLTEKIESILLKPRSTHATTNDLLKGAIIPPLVTGLKSMDVLSLEKDRDNFCETIGQLDKKLAQAIKKLFVQENWLSNDRLTAEGRFLLENGQFAEVIAYRPMLHAMSDLLSGKGRHAFHDLKGTASTAQQQSWRKDLHQEIIHIFNQSPVDQQPRAIVAVSCTDVTLLEEIYRIVQEHTLRGQELEQHPLLLIGTDDNGKATGTLTSTGMEHRILSGDMHNPDAILKALEDIGEVLYIHSFANRHVRVDAKQPADKSVAPLVAGQLEYYLDQEGQLLHVSTVLSHWQQYFQVWANSIGKSGLLVLEAHTLPANKTFEYLDRSENYYADTVHCLAGQHLITAEAFLILAANAGLFNRYQVKRYPELSAFCRISLHQLIKRDYIIRFATEDDLESLVELEKLCWAEQLKATEEQLIARLRQYPQGQFVLEKEGQVLGVIYSQRIVNDAELDSYDAGNVHELHNPAGAVIQLIAVNIHPDSQIFGYGDQLLEFMLQRCSLIPGIIRVVAVSLCKKFDANEGLPIERYIQQKGSKQDPIMAFHDAHGAMIVKPMPNYRPLDYANQGYGVLVVYDILNRVAQSRKNISIEKPKPVTVKERTVFSQAAISQFLLEKVNGLLEYKVTPDDFDRPVMETGLNSVDLMALQKQIEGKFHLTLQPGFFFEFNNINKVIGYLSSQLNTTEDSNLQPVEGDATQQEETPDTDIAIIGISCKLPGGIESAEELWNVLASAECMISPYPVERGDWPAGAEYPGVDQGGFIHHADAFDAAFFRMSPKEAQITDPQQRILLQLTWACLEDASLVPAALKGSNTGVFIGASNCDYIRLMQASGMAAQAHHAIGGSLAVLANRLSYFYDFNGPSLTIDTACSASLVALHTAIKSLHASECDTALVGGVNFICYPELSIAYQSAGMLAPDSRCKVFDANANGYVRSEGAVIMLLKPLSKAIADHNHIHAVIKGSAVNHGGLGGGLTVPNPLKQSELYTAAWKNAGISPQNLSYIEAHGTGTSLGDPIEIQGIKTAYTKLVPADQVNVCAIGSVKSNLGHLESAAGITGLLKVVLSMQHRQLPASINYEELNPKIYFQGTYFYIQRQLQDWDASGPLLAGVSSFGSGGANAHVVVQEYVDDATADVVIEENLFILSAVSIERLQDYVKKVLDWSEKAAGYTNFTDAIYSWQTGRTAMKHRLAIRVKDWQDLRYKLQQWLTDRNHAADCRTGVVNQGGAGIDGQLSGKSLEQLAEKWVSGADIAWQQLYTETFFGECSPRLISLPTYPFSRERHWIKVAEKVSPSPKPVATTVQTAAPITVPRQIPIPLSVNQRIVFNTPEIQKPANISLTAPGAIAVEEKKLPAPGKVSVTLSNTTIEPGQEYVRLFDNGNGIYAIKTDSTNAAVIVQLQHALAYVQQSPSVKVLMLEGDVFLQQGRASYNVAVAHQLFQTIASLPFPVMAVMQNGATGAGFLAGALCDFMICSEDGRYAYTDYEAGMFPTANEVLLFSERFGEVLAADFLHQPTASKGHDLKAKGWSCPILPSDQVAAYAQQLALELAGKSDTSLRLLKQHLGRHINMLVQQLTRVEPLKEENKTSSTDAEQVLRFSITNGKKKFKLKEVVSGLSEVIAQMDQHNTYKAIVLCSDDPEFIPVSNLTDEVLALQQLILDAPVPVIVAITSNAKDIAWLISQYCDACIYSEEGVYSLTNILQTPEPALQAALMFSHRLGHRACNEILLTGKSFTGVALQQLTGAITIAAKNDVVAKAMELAAIWAIQPMEEVILRRKVINEKIKQLPSWPEIREVAAILPQTPAAIELKSNVIRAVLYPEGIVEVKMEDREAKNMFSPAFIEGIMEVFAHIAATPAYKVVILTGYDSYFSSGGTKEMLLDIQDGKIKFTDAGIYHLAMECKIPVIAAMQGHGLGAGWSMGMFADFILFSEESHYVSPYMRYGFTPGAGATLIFPDKAGYDLARETLLTANEYSGGQLKNKGLRYPVLSRKELLAAAFTLARQIAQNPRNSLVAVKQQLTSHLQQQLTSTYALELAMHEKTFVGRSDTLEQIENNFYQEDNIPTTAADTAEKPVFTTSRADVLPAITADLKTLLAQELHMQEEEIDENKQFVDLGLDSITGVTFIRKINEKYRVSINATKVYSHPNLAQFSLFVKEEAEKNDTLPFHTAPEKQVLPVSRPVALQSTSVPLSTVSTTVSQQQSYPTSAIAVIGMAGQFPEAKHVEAFWQNIAGGKNCIREISPKRWSTDKYYQEGSPVPGKTYSKWMGALEEFDLFDPLFFNISPSEAESMDPQQRLFLQSCWHAIENAGYNAKSLSNSKCGVFVGCGQGDYHLLSRELQISAHGFTGGDNAVLAARISYFLNLQGPCLSIDTACSSSLVAIANACDSLALGKSDLVLAGGVYIGAGSDMHIKTAQMGMLSPDGKCYTFDQRANGFVPGEGVGVVMLKRLEDAERDQDNILGVIQGWGVNQDGKTNGITAPNTEAQSLLQQEVYEKYNIDPASIQLVEAHGTGTKLGDPIEVEALVNSFKKYTRKKGYCALGSVKSNIGHCLMAAGVAGVIKLLLSLKYKQLPPTINFEKLNEHISLDDSPFYVNTELKDWELHDAPLRKAAISSFGFSGTNAHLVIAEYPETAVPGSVQNTECIIPLSARTEEQLKQKVMDLLYFIRHANHFPDLAEMAYTLQTGRVAMEQRLGFIAGTADQLAEKLQAYLDGKHRADDTFSGTKRNEDTIALFNRDTDLQETVDKWIQQQKLANLISLWVKGYDLDWNRLYNQVKPRRIGLPVYPFAKERYWIDTEAVNDSAASTAAGPLLHPLLHRNISMLHQQMYSATFTGKEIFLKNAPQNGGKVLPELACLEMARAAMEHSLPSSSGIVELHHIGWGEQLIVDNHTACTIALYEKDNGDVDYEICSKAGDETIVHCQGEARISSSSLPVRVDVEQLKGQMKQREINTTHQGLTDIYQGDHQLLAILLLSDKTSGGFILPPAIQEPVLQAAGLLRNNHQPTIPVSLRSIRLISACTPEMFMWVRYRPDSDTFDIDLCNTQGNVCMQMEGLVTTTVQPDVIQETTQTLFFNEYWQQHPAINTASADQPAIIFMDKNFRETAGQLSNVIIVEQGDNYQQVTPQLYQCRLHHPEDLHKILHHIATAANKPAHIVYTWAKDQGEKGIHLLFDLFKAIKSSAPYVSRVTLVGRYHPSDAATCWDYAWIGFERSLKLLLPNIQLSLLYTDTPSCTCQQLLDAMQNTGIWWYKEGESYLLSLQSGTPHKTTQESVLKQHGSYLITGGCGSLGLKFARYLAENYHANLLLTGRRPITADMEAQLKALKEAGAGEVYYRSVDVSDSAAVLSLKSTFPFNLSGIIHAAGVESAEPFYSRSTADINTVLHPKTIGSILLDEAFDQPSLDFICYFSSVSAFVGDFGSCDYAIASRFQMAYSHYREQQGRHGKTVVINWPLWQEGGMSAGDSEQTSFYLKSSGQEPLQTAAGIAIWHDLLRSAAVQTLVMLGKPTRVGQLLNRLYQTEQPFRAENMPAQTSGLAGKGWKPQYQGLSLKECVTSDLKQLISAQTKISQHTLQDTKNLTDYGFDSIGLSRLAKELTVHFGLEVTPAIFFSATGIGKLSDHFLREHCAHMEGFYNQPETSDHTGERNILPVKPVAHRRPMSRVHPAIPATRHQEPIAIIGMSGRFPQAETVDQFWTLLAEGKNAITEIPASRWDWRNYFTTPGDANNKIATNKGGFINGVDTFDPLFFEISPREAEHMDPAERLLLMEAYRAIEDARISPHTIRGGNVGVFVGMEEGQYDLITGKQGITTTGNAMISSRLSYFLDLHGPAIATNTACSSGLVALHQAVASLRQGECKAALVAGVSLLLSPENYVMMSEAGMLSADGQCHTFSKNANGIGVGESVVVLMLKPLSAAIADGDAIYGTIKASGINFDGKTNGVTAPNGDRQADLIEKIYSDHQIDTNDLSYIITHGTGTRLGDPVEINALVKAFKKLNGHPSAANKQAHCALTSCKSNIGHTMAASGLVSVVNLLKAMQYRQIPASLNCEEENDYIIWQDSPFYINKETRQWNNAAHKPYMGAVSSFGRSGTNAHVVLEEYRAPVENIPATTPGDKVIMLLSARTEDRLKQKARDLFNFISIPSSQKEMDLTALAYSLQVCREEFEVRLGFLVGSLTQLKEKLQAYLDGKSDVEDSYQGKVKRNNEGMSIINDDDDMKEAIDKWIARKKLSKLMELWVKGLVIDWEKFYSTHKPKRIGLPVYPFAQDRYWIAATEKMAAGNTFHILHPFVHRNTSDLTQQSYHSTFNGNESFLMDAQEAGCKLLPAMVYLEMARAAVQLAMPPTEAAAIIQLHDLVWMEPCIVNENRHIKIELTAHDNQQVSYEMISTDTDREVVHLQGQALFNRMEIPATLDVNDLLKQMDPDTKTISGLLDRSLQATGTIYHGHQQLLVKLKVPPAGQLANCVLHPGIIDGILQACSTLMADTALPVPVSLAALTVVTACVEEMFAWIRYSTEAQPNEGRILLDIDLCDSAGNIAVIMEGLELAGDTPLTATPTDQLWDKVSYLTKWEEQPALTRNAAVEGKTVLIVCSGTTAGLEDEILKCYDHSTTLLISISDKTAQLSDNAWSCGITDPEGFQTCLQQMDSIDTLYFLSMPDQPMDAVLPEDLMYSQESNEIQFLRLVKFLKQNEKIKERVESYILTLDTHSINEQPNQCTGAGITGLAYSLAQGSYQFRVRNLDLSAADLKTAADRRKVLDIILSEPPTDRGEVFKIHSGKRYRQTLYQLNWDTSGSSAIRKHGVYLIVGGSGTIGKIITRNLIEKYEATVIWVGRSAADSARVQASLQLFENYRENLRYMQADVTEMDSFRQAVEAIKQHDPTIHGAIFAGMVFDFENSLDQTTEAAFRSIFDLKARGSRVFHDVLKKEPLDFMCYFSSGQAYSFSGASKLSAYASGITYADSFVHAIRKHTDVPVGMINWGFWKSSIETIAANNDTVSTDNFDALEDAEGFSCFEQFIKELRQHRIHQVLCMKSSQHITSLMNCNKQETISLMGMPASSSVSFPAGSIDIPNDKINTLIQTGEKNGPDEWFLQLLYAQIVKLISSTDRANALHTSDLRKQGKILDKYTPWWNTCLHLLSRHHLIQLTDHVVSGWKNTDTEMVWNKWQVQKEQYLQDPDQRARVMLVNDCLEKLPEILQGKTPATDVIFPDSSMEKVEGIYKNNLLSDTFNEIIANAVVAYVQQRLQADPHARLKMLEIGAGTGGTSAVVFSKLQPFRSSIEKYTYTDLSKAFFFHAEKNYLPDNPYIQCQRLDIEQPVAEQGIETGTYDLVIATNVLHATRDIRRTLRHAKAILHQNGYLLLNELSSTSLFSHLTFGLLDGWWLFKDEELRMPGSPGLYPATWQQVMAEEGFSAVLFPAAEAHCLGQQIILAQSDGAVRQTAAVKKQQPVAPPLTKKPPVVKQPHAANTSKPAQNIGEYIRIKILHCLSQTLKIPADSIDPDLAFSDYGIDSILGVSFINHINGALSVTLNTAIIFEHSSVNRLSKHVMGAYQPQIESGMEKAPVVEEESAPLPEYEEQAKAKTPRNRFVLSPKISKKQHTDKKEHTTDIAVVGMSGMFPKADNIHEFWNNLVTGVDGVDELPGNYLDQENYFSAGKQPGKTRCKWGGVIENRDCFDPLFFNISPKEAASMNPHQRLVLQEGWKAIEDAGYNPRTLSGTQTGIYIGAEPTGYIGESFTGYSDAIIASRLSYILNLNGPSFVVNTGCSSSAVALHLACESLRNNEIDMALAGGVNACLEQDMLIRLDEIEMLSPSGRCFTFDQAADGTIMSEGIGIVVLKRLEDAIAAGDNIYGLISGSGINQDGASNGITAPNGAAQEKLIVDVYHKFNIHPERISYVEAHGTGTRLGDPVETNALVRAFRSFTEHKEFCAVGSAKSYIGHTAAAAGIIGLIKVLLSMQHNLIPRLLNFRSINPLIEFSNSPFYINTAVAEWKPLKDTPRLAAINSFGHSGTNAHLVVKEYLPPAGYQRTPVATTNNPVVVPLSAKTQEQLQQKAADLLSFIRAENITGGTIDLTDMAYTLQVGREAMEERLGFIVHSVDALAEKLEAYINGERTIENVWAGQARRNKDMHTLFSKEVDLQEIIDKWIAGNKLSNLLDVWVKGLDMDWHKLYPAGNPNRINLPSYPFAKERYWFNTSKSREITSSSAITPAVIHPLLHVNTADLSQQSYTTDFNGEEFFLKDHRVNKQLVLPAVAYLEMAREAVSQASPVHDKPFMVELLNTVWLKPVVVAGHKQVAIALFENEEDGRSAEKIDFEIYSNTDGQEEDTIHCQGQAVIRKLKAPDMLDIGQLKERMQHGKLEPAAIYDAFRKMGTDYGPAHQGITAVYMGENELLAHLRLPAVAEDRYHEFTLHPGLMDSALQACIGLMVDMDDLPSRPLLPFALESVSIIAACTKEMFVWARYAQGAKPGDKLIKVDLDLCDPDGNVCVQLHGFSSRALEGKTAVTPQITTGNQSYDDDFYNNVIDKVLNNEMSAEEAAALN